MKKFRIGLFLTVIFSGLVLFAITHQRPGFGQDGSNISKDGIVIEDEE